MDNKDLDNKDLDSKDAEISELIANSESAKSESEELSLKTKEGGEAEKVVDAEKGDADKKAIESDDGKFFKKYKIKDIVFLAIITACTLVTGAVMPLLVNVPLFGIIQLGLGLQFSIFPVIGLMKVKKPGALIFQSLFISVFLVFMFPPMVMIILCAVVAEAVALVIFRGYKNDWACVVAGTLYMPMTLPLLYLYYQCFYTVSEGEEVKQAVSMFINGADPMVVVGISAAVVALCFVGSVIGMLISRELKKAGKFK